MDRRRTANGNAAIANGNAGQENQAPNQYGETNESTTQKGMELMAMMKDCKDKNGRAATVQFYELPPKEDSKYYSIVKAPISLNLIEQKLKDREFPTLTALESYVKRMVQNVKETEIRDSPGYKDIDRMRKLVANWMKKANPAYRSAQYQPAPTPLTDAFIEHHQALARGEDPGKNKDIFPSDTPLPVSNKQNNRRASDAQKRRASSTPAPPVSMNEFDGMSFQEALQDIIKEMMEHRADEDDDGYPQFDLFIKLPPRSYKEYYEVIPNPICLSDLLKAVSDKSGKIKYKTWKEFETDVSLLWKNARHFNMDDSEPFKLSIDLEKYFKQRVKQAKKVVYDPSQEPKQEAPRAAGKIKLRLGKPAEQEPAPTPKISLRLGGKPPAVPTPAATPTARKSSPEPKENLAPSTEEAGKMSTKRKRSSDADAVADAVLAKHHKKTPTPSRERSASVKLNETPVIPAKSATPTPAPSPKPQSDGGQMMPPPRANPLRPITANGDRPDGAATVAAAAPVEQPPAQLPAQPSPVRAPPPIPYHPKYHPDGKNASNALIKQVEISTHPGLNLGSKGQHYKETFYAHEYEAQQAFAIPFSNVHYFIQIKPTFAAINRHHKIFVTIHHNGQAQARPLQAMPQTPGEPVNPLNPLYETRLTAGNTTKIDIECIADASPEVKAASGQNIEHEKISILAFLRY